MGLNRVEVIAKWIRTPAALDVLARERTSAGKVSAMRRALGSSFGRQTCSDAQLLALFRDASRLNLRRLAIDEIGWRARAEQVADKAVSNARDELRAAARMMAVVLDEHGTRTVNAAPVRAALAALTTALEGVRYLARPLPTVERQIAAIERAHTLPEQPEPDDDWDPAEGERVRALVEAATRRKRGRPRAETADEDVFSRLVAAGATKTEAAAALHVSRETMPKRARRRGQKP